MHHKYFVADSDSIYGAFYFKRLKKDPVTVADISDFDLSFPSWFES